MSAPTLQLAHGDHSTLLLLSSRPDYQTWGLDAVSCQFQGNAAAGASLSKGAAVPGHAGFIIESMTPERLGNYYLYDVRGVGLVGGVAKRMKNGYRETNSLADWDGYSDRRIALTKDLFTKGQRVGNFVCTATENVEMMTGVGLWETSGTFVGLRSGAGTRRRQVTSNGQVITGDSITVSLEGGWSTARKGQVSLPKILVTDTYPSLNPPATQAVPSLLTPPNAPPIRGIVFTGDSRREVWPGGGWSFTCGYEQPFGQTVSLYMVTETYEFQLRYLPA